MWCCTWTVFGKCCWLSAAKATTTTKNWIENDVYVVEMLNSERVDNVKEFKMSIVVVIMCVAWLVALYVIIKVFSVVSREACVYSRSDKPIFASNSAI